MVGWFVFVVFMCCQSMSDDDTDDVYGDKKGKSSVCVDCRQITQRLYINNNLFLENYDDVYVYSVFVGHIERKLILFDSSVVM